MVNYPSKELELISVTTVTNIISLIQFALIPLNSAKETADADAAESQKLGTVQKVRNFISADMSWAAKLFNAPLEFAQRFTEIATPLRVLLFAAIMFGLLNLLIVTFFVPAWRMILFIFDLFVPGMMLFGIQWIAMDYREQKSVATVLVLLGLVYVVFRVAWMLWPVIRRLNVMWSDKAIHQITAIFLNRITQQTRPEELDARAVAIQKKFYEMDVGLLPLCQYNFDENGEPAPMIPGDDKDPPKLPEKWHKGIWIDIGFAAFLGVLCIALLGAGWENLISATYQGVQGNTMADIAGIITITFLVATILRIVTGLLTIFVPAYRKIAIILRRRFFQLIVVLSGITLLPILSMILRSTDTKNVSCNWLEYMDFRSNTENFLDYFMLRNATCIPCTRVSATSFDLCGQVCTYNRSTAPLEYQVLQDAPQVNEDDLTRIYLIPINLLEVYFLAIFVQVERQLFTHTLDLLECLPAPTQHVESKFASLLVTLQTKAGYIFTSYRHEQSLFYFTFTQVKLFVLFFASLFPIFPVEAVQAMASDLIPWMFFVVSLIFSLMQLKINPYISILHNAVNAVGYFVGAIAAMIAALAVGGTEIPPVVGTVFLVLIFVAPIVTALLVPLFTRKDDLLKPTNFDDETALAYELHLVDRHERFLRKFDPEENGGKTNDTSDPEAPELSDIHGAEDSKRSTGGSLVKKGFPLANYQPIQIQMGLADPVARKKPEMRKAKVVWPLADVDAGRAAAAAREMQWLADGVLDVNSFNSLVQLMNVSVIFVSCCLGWGLGAGIVIWKRGFPTDYRPIEEALEYYLRCNGARIGGQWVFPEYGTY
jgi:hypothetical protein